MKIRVRSVGRSSIGDEVFDGELDAASVTDIVTGSISGIVVIVAPEGVVGF